MIPLEEAVEVFVQGFRLGRSLTAPFVAERLDQAWLMRDPPGGKYPRTGELVTTCLGPHEMRARAQEARAGRHWVLFLAVAGEEARWEREYKQAGLRLARREPFFVRDVREPASRPDPRVTEIRTREEILEFGRILGAKSSLKSLGGDDPDSRQFVVREGTEIVGWVRSVRTAPDRAWVSNLGVRESHRRRGLATALMESMLAVDAQRGIRWSVLLASNTGALVYPKLGYQRIGTLLMFHPETRW